MCHKQYQLVSLLVSQTLEERVHILSLAEHLYCMPCRALEDGFPMMKGDWLLPWLAYSTGFCSQAHPIADDRVF